jgi:hypothetical protein
MDRDYINEHLIEFALKRPDSEWKTRSMFHGIAIKSQMCDFYIDVACHDFSMVGTCEIKIFNGWGDESYRYVVPNMDLYSKVFRINQEYRDAGPLTIDDLIEGIEPELAEHFRQVL